MTKRLGLYVVVRVAAGIAAMLTILTMVILLTEVVESARSLSGHADVDFPDILQLALMRTPFLLLQLLPFAFLFGAMAGFIVLNRRGELVALRAAGVSAWAFVGPAAVAAMVAGVLAVTVIHPLAAQLEGAAQARKAALTEGTSHAAASEIWLRQGDGRGQIVIHARSHETRGDAVLLSGVSMFVESFGPSGRLAPSRRIEAAEARLIPGAWRLTNAREIAPGGELERAEQLSVPSTLDRSSAMERFVSPAAAPLWRLPETVRAARAAGYSSARYETRLQQLLALPLMLGAMTLVAAVVSLRPTRLGRLPLLCAIGVAGGFAVFFTDTLCATLGSAAILPPLVAGWSPPLLTLCLSAAVLCYTEDG